MYFFIPYSNYSTMNCLDRVEYTQMSQPCEGEFGIEAEESLTSCLQLELEMFHNTSSVHKVPRLSLHFEHLFPKLPHIYLSRDIKSVSELYGKGLYVKCGCRI
jgi:hypothetical protein